MSLLNPFDVRKWEIVEVNRYNLWCMVSWVMIGYGLVLTGLLGLLVARLVPVETVILASAVLMLVGVALMRYIVSLIRTLPIREAATLYPRFQTTTEAAQSHAQEITPDAQTLNRAGIPLTAPYPPSHP